MKYLSAGLLSPVVAGSNPGGPTIQNSIYKSLVVSVR